jgi:hypothetical protein
MTRAIIPIGECGLLSRRNALRYCGCLGEEKFDQIVAPHVRVRWLGARRFYLRRDLDQWIEGAGEPAPLTVQDIIAGMGEPLDTQRPARPNPQRERPG